MPGRCVVFGGSGGLGQVLTPLIESHFDETMSLSSSDCDLENDRAVREFFDKYPADVVVNLAVKNIDSLVHKTGEFETAAQLQVNCAGYASILRHSLKSMRSQEYGRIIFVSSVLSQRITAGTGIYAACKSFNETLTKVAAHENKTHGITCNVLRLGYFEAGLTARVPEVTRKQILAEVGRFGTAGELADAIWFLVKHEYVNGAVLDLNGGLL